MKQVTIIGNLGANAVRRNTSDGRELMSFSVAVNDRDTTTWFNCIGAVRTKQFDYLVKGAQVAITGDIVVKIYQGQPDIQVNIDHIELCGGKKDTETQQQPF